VTQDGSSVRNDDSPTPTAANASSTVADSKKKHGLTLGNRFRSKQPLEQTPLPPETPTKAAKFLGINPENIPAAVSRSSPAPNDGSSLDGVNDEPTRVRYGWPQQHSAPAPTASKNTSASRIFEDIEVSDDDEPQPAKTFWEHGKDVAKKMSGTLSPFTTRDSPSPRHYSSPQLTTTDWKELQADYVHSIGIPQPDESSSDANPAHNRRSSHGKRQGKQPKELNRMTPITEASHDNISAAYRDDGDDTELEVIDEYTRGSISHGTLVIPPRSESLQAFPRYELAQDDWVSTDDNFEQNTYAKSVLFPSGVPSDMKNSKEKQPAVLRLRSPLQAVEDRFLDATEMELGLKAQKHSKVKEEEEEELSEEEGSPVHDKPVELSKGKGKQPAPEGPSATCEDCHGSSIEARLEKMVAELDLEEAERLAMDKKVAAMKEAHEKFKKEFYAKYGPGQANNNTADSNSNDDAIDEAKVDHHHDDEEDDGHEDDDDLPSLRSSIDLSEEPTVHIAVAMPIYRIPAGMVKLVDIPPRKKKST
jgi:hypothetical protein